MRIFHVLPIVFDLITICPACRSFVDNSLSTQRGTRSAFFVVSMSLSLCGVLEMMMCEVVVIVAVADNNNNNARGKEVTTTTGNHMNVGLAPTPPLPSTGIRQWLLVQEELLGEKSRFTASLMYWSAETMGVLLPQHPRSLTLPPTQRRRQQRLHCP